MTVYTVPVPENKFTQQTRLRIGEAVYLLGYLIRHVNWETGRACITHERIAADTGFPPRTIARWFQVLADAGEIDTRKTRYGTLVRIIDYEAIARTRRIPTTSNMPDPACYAQPHMPPAAVEHAADGSSNMPPAAVEHAADGVTNIKRIHVPSKVQSFSKPPSSLCDDTDSPACEPGRETSHHQEIGLREAQQAVAALTDVEYQALFRRAMEELETDPNPFRRIFVRRTPQGELEPNPRYGQMMIIRKMAEIAGPPGESCLAGAELNR